MSNEISLFSNNYIFSNIRFYIDNDEIKTTDILNEVFQKSQKKSNELTSDDLDELRVNFFKKVFERHSDQFCLDQITLNFEELDIQNKTYRTNLAKFISNQAKWPYKLENILKNYLDEMSESDRIEIFKRMILQDKNILYDISFNKFKIENENIRLELYKFMVDHDLSMAKEINQFNIENEDNREKCLKHIAKKDFKLAVEILFNKLKVGNDDEFVRLFFFLFKENPELTVLNASYLSNQIKDEKKYLACALKIFIHFVQQGLRFSYYWVPPIDTKEISDAKSIELQLQLAWKRASEIIEKDKAYYLCFLIRELTILQNINEKNLIDFITCFLKEFSGCENELAVHFEKMNISSLEMTVKVMNCLIQKDRKVFPHLAKYCAQHLEEKKRIELFKKLMILQNNLIINHVEDLPVEQEGKIEILRFLVDENPKLGLKHFSYFSYFSIDEEEERFQFFLAFARKKTNCLSLPETKHFQLQSERILPMLVYLPNSFSVESESSWEEEVEIDDDIVDTHPLFNAVWKKAQAIPDTQKKQKRERCSWIKQDLKRYFFLTKIYQEENEGLKPLIRSLYNLPTPALRKKCSQVLFPHLLNPQAWNDWKTLLAEVDSNVIIPFCLGDQILFTSASSQAARKAWLKNLNEVNKAFSPGDKQALLVNFLLVLYDSPLTAEEKKHVLAQGFYPSFVVEKFLDLVLDLEKSKTKISEKEQKERVAVIKEQYKVLTQGFYPSLLDLEKVLDPVLDLEKSKIKITKEGRLKRITAIKEQYYKFLTQGFYPPLPDLEKSKTEITKEERFKRERAIKELYFERLRLLTSLLRLNGEKKIAVNHPLKVAGLKGLLKEQFVHVTGINVHSVENFGEAYATYIGSMRDEMAIFTYLGQINKREKELREQMKKVYSEFVIALLQGRFHEFRYRTPHLAYLEAQGYDLKAWKRGGGERPLVTVEQEHKKSEPFTMQFHVFLKQKLITDRHIENLDQQFPFLFQYLKGTLSLAEAQEKASTDESEILSLCNEEIDTPDFSRLIDFLEINAFQQFAKDVKEFKTAYLAAKEQNSYVGYQLVDTDDVSDLILVGRETGGCTNIDDGINDQAALANVSDGKIRILCIKDPQEKQVARHLLRLLWDNTEKAPILVLERLYTYDLSPILKDALLEFAKEQAERLGLLILESGKEKDMGKRTPYPGEVVSMGSNAPVEYTDAGDGLTNGQYSLTNLYTL